MNLYSMVIKKKCNEKNQLKINSWKIYPVQKDTNMYYTDKYDVLQLVSILPLIGTWHLLRQHLLLLGHSSSDVQSFTKVLTAVGERPWHSPGFPDEIIPTKSTKNITSITQ